MGEAKRRKSPDPNYGEEKPLVQSLIQERFLNRVLEKEFKVWSIAFFALAKCPQVSVEIVGDYIWIIPHKEALSLTQEFPSLNPSDYRGLIVYSEIQKKLWWRPILVTEVNRSLNWLKHKGFCVTELDKLDPLYAFCLPS